MFKTCDKKSTWPVVLFDSPESKRSWNDRLMMKAYQVQEGIRYSERNIIREGQAMEARLTYLVANE